MSTAYSAGYTENSIGVRRLAGLVSGTGGHIVLGGLTLGTAPQQTTISDLENMGYPDEWINLLVGLDATDEQLQELAGIDPVASSQAAAQTVVSLATSLYAASGLPGSAPIPLDLAQAAAGSPVAGSNSTGVAPSGTQTPAGTASAAPSTTPAIPSGSTITYAVSWTAGFGNLSTSPNSVISSMMSKLPQYGMSVTAGVATADGPITYGVQFTITDTIGHAQVSDAQSVLNSLMQSIVGNNLSGSTVTPGAPQTTVTGWLEQNWPLALAGAVALIFGIKIFQEL